MASMMCVTLLVGCGDDSSASDSGSSAPANQGETATGGENRDQPSDDAVVFDTSEHVVLTMYCIGDEGGVHAQEHLDLINAMLTEKINAELDPIMVSWGEYKEKLPMAWASGEAYDLTYTSNWTNYYVEAARGAFMDITDLFPVYAPETYKYMQGKDLLDSTSVDGRLYMVPKDEPDYTTFLYVYREDLRKKYNCPEITSYEALETYMQAIKDNEPEMMPFGTMGTDTMLQATRLNELDWSRGIDGSGAGIFAYKISDSMEDGAVEVFNMIDTPEQMEFYEMVKKWYDNGYWSQSILAQTTAGYEQFEAGKAAVCLRNISNSHSIYQNAQTQHPDWEIGYWSSDLALSDLTELVAPSNNGVAVGAYSKNPERALMFVELMYNDQELHELVMDGIEGVTIEHNYDNMTKRVPDGVPAEECALKNLGMQFGTIKFKFGSENDNPIVKEIAAEYDKHQTVPPLAGFSLNPDPISAELAAMKNVYTEYGEPLLKGAAGDPAAAIEVYRQQLETAGSQKVLEEIQKQVNEYIANNP